MTGWLRLLSLSGEVAGSLSCAASSREAIGYEARVARPSLTGGGRRHKRPVTPEFPEADAFPLSSTFAGGSFRSWECAR